MMSCLDIYRTLYCEMNYTVFVSQTDTHWTQLKAFSTIPVRTETTAYTLPVTKLEELRNLKWIYWRRGQKCTRFLCFLACFVVVIEGHFFIVFLLQNESPFQVGSVMDEKWHQVFAESPEIFSNPVSVFGILYFLHIQGHRNFLQHGGLCIKSTKWLLVWAMEKHCRSGDSAVFILNGSYWMNMWRYLRIVTSTALAKSHSWLQIRSGPFGEERITSIRNRNSS